MPDKFLAKLSWNSYNLWPVL